VVLVCASSAQASSGPRVTVRVEGKTHTLLASKAVRLKSGWLTRGGAKKGDCSTATAAGALDQATHHRWGGPYKSAYSDYEILSILGEKTNFTTSFWEIFAGHVAATTGACGIKPHGGEQLVFAVVSVNDYGDYLLAITGAPRHATVGHPFTVKVVYYDATGKARALGGATLSAGGTTVTTDSLGRATVTPTKAGALVLRAAHADTHKGGHQYGYVRAAAVRVTVG
jgi:hypothetical protein